MKKNLAKKVTLSILAGAVLMSSSVVWAADITDSSSNILWHDESYGYVRDATNNSDGTVPNDTYNKSFYGAYDSGNAGVSGGKVTISSGKFSNYIIGGYSSSGDATGGKVTIEGGNFGVTNSANSHGYIYGGNAGNGDATGNAVTINGGHFSFDIYGGQGEGAIVESNSVLIKQGNFYPGFRFGSIDDYNGIMIYGGGSYTSSTRVKNNTVQVDDITLIEANVTIENSTFQRKGLHGIYGGFNAGTSENAIARVEGNKVILTGGEYMFTGAPGAESINDAPLGIAGGYVRKNGEVLGNSVTITGGQYDMQNDRHVEIFGGYAKDGNAKDNIINISGTAILEDVKLYGGYSGSGGVVSGNTLNIGINEALLKELDPADKDGNRKYGLQVGAWNNKKVKSIQGFDVINFYNLEWNNGNTIVETEEAHLSPNGTKINVHVASGVMNLNESMTLIKSVSDITGKVHDDSKQPFEIFEGVDKVYGGQISQPDNKSIIVKIVGEYEVPGGGTDDNTGSGTTGGGTDDNTGSGTTGGGTGGNTDDNTGTGTTPQPERNNQVLVLGESRAAAVAFTNQGSELIETGLNALVRDNEKDTKVFAAVYGNHSEYETGSHVNVNGWSGIVGIGKTNDNGLTVGAFFENGEGNYSTHNIFTDDYIRGDGEACYNGGGFLVRKDNANGVYAEASLRAGNLQNELRNAVRNGADLTGYDVDTFYYGAHVGIGKVIARGNDGDSLDVYGKFIYTHHDGETFYIGGTATKFDSVESERLRLGFRINEVQTNKLAMYYGAAWEYEFNGDAHDKIASFDLETPSLEGSTIIGEIGAHYKASEKWSFDLNGRAYVGQREGFSGSVQANYAF